MADLTKDDIKSMAKAVSLDIKEPHLSEVTYNINALKELLDDLNPPGLENVEPLPIIHPNQWPPASDAPAAKRATAKRSTARKPAAKKTARRSSR
jgi:hypothetical protein